MANLMQSAVPLLCIASSIRCFSPNRLFSVWSSSELWKSCPSRLLRYGNEFSLRNHWKKRWRIDVRINNYKLTVVTRSESVSLQIITRTFFCILMTCTLKALVIFQEVTIISSTETEKWVIFMTLLLIFECQQEIFHNLSHGKVLLSY